MNSVSPRQNLEDALKEVSRRAADSPENVELMFERANLLSTLRRHEEAKTAYLALLAHAPAHFGALTNFANMLYATGYTSAAHILYLEAVTHHPGRPAGHINLAGLLAATQQPLKAMEHYQLALDQDPDHPEANRGMAYLLTESRDEERAAVHRRKAFEGRAVTVLPYMGDGAPVRLLLLVSGYGGVIPMLHHLDDRVFEVTVIVVEFYDASQPLPPHDVIFNAIADADLCRTGLEMAQKLTAATDIPVLNPPARVAPTGRVAGMRLLGELSGVIAPKTSLFSRVALLGEDAVSELASAGFVFPLLLRAPGFHTGKFFTRVGTLAELASAVNALPGDALLVIEYLDARGADGKSRKYRVMMVGGALYPLHAAVSDDWKIHYYTADMAGNRAHRAEDEAFLHQMGEVIGEKALRGLETIQEALKLDYGGVDFGLDDNGNLLLFEANASMVVYPPAPDAKWDYRRPATQCIMAAVRHLLTSHAR